MPITRERHLVLPKGAGTLLRVGPARATRQRISWRWSKVLRWHRWHLIGSREERLTLIAETILTAKTILVTVAVLTAETILVTVARFRRHGRKGRAIEACLAKVLLTKGRLTRTRLTKALLAIKSTQTQIAKGR